MGGALNGADPRERPMCWEGGGVAGPISVVGSRRTSLGWQWVRFRSGSLILGGSGMVGLIQISWFVLDPILVEMKNGPEPW